MLSRFSLAANKSLKRYVLKFHPISGITTSAASPDSTGKTNSPAASNHPPEYPPPTSKRDFVNFPRPIFKDTAPPVRMGFIPESWFQFLYPKTGYTGPYMLGLGILTFIFSKEHLVLDHYGAQLFSVIALSIIVKVNFGDKIEEFYNQYLEKNLDALDGEQEREKKAIRDEIKYLEGVNEMKFAVQEITKGTTENVHLQMELAFRERLHEVYKQVKNKLDFQAELEEVERRIVQKNLMDYVLSNVIKSLTPDMEKNSLQLCIKDLNSLSAKS